MNSGIPSPRQPVAAAVGSNASTHESFVHRVRKLVAAKVADEASRARLLAAKLIYGVGSGYRGVCLFRAWQNSDAHDLIEIAASGEESLVQLAGTTIHESGHVLAGIGAGHGTTWKAMCRELGLLRAVAAGQRYAVADFDAALWARISALPAPEDGTPAFRAGAHAGLSRVLRQPRTLAVSRRVGPVRRLVARLGGRQPAAPVALRVPPACPGADGRRRFRRALRSMRQRV